MTLQEILKAKGLSDEDIESVIGEMKQNKIFTAAEENLDIRYGKLKGEHDTLAQQYSQANALIDQLKKGTKADEELQGKITSYETQVQSLQEQLAETKLKSALKVALLSEKAEEAVVGSYPENTIREEFGTGQYTLNGDGRTTPWDISPLTASPAHKPSVRVICWRRNKLTWR